MRTRDGVAAAVVGALLLTGCAPGSPEEPRVTDTAAPDGDSSSEAIAPTDAPSASGTPSTPATAEPGDAASVRLAVEQVAEGFAAPLQVLTSPWDDLLVVEQVGRVRRVHDGAVSTYLDLTDRVTSGGERGLLGIAFDPASDDRGRLFVHYSGANGATTLSRFDAAEESADAVSEVVLLTVDQPAANHNGGQVAFGPDGMLYLGLGDGGGAGDRYGNGQRPDTLLGTILRFDVSGDAYAVPPDNPWADGGAGAPEVWAYGLRNPWRFAFGGGRLYVADVGQNAVEEVDAVPAETAGVDYGWPILEGSTCFRDPTCDPAGTELPVTEYRHDETGGCSIIGGVVDPGVVVPELGGWFLYSDLCAGFLRAVTVAEDGTVREVDVTPVSGPVEGILGFGVGPDGAVHAAVQDGRILRLVAAR